MSDKTFLKETDGGKLFIDLPAVVLEKLGWKEGTKLKLEIAAGWDETKPTTLVITETKK